MDSDDQLAGELTSAALAVMTAWVDDPADHGRLHALLVELDGAGVRDVAGVPVSAMSVGLVNLCAVLLLQLADELDCEPLEVLSHHGEQFARLAAGLEVSPDRP